MKTRFDVSYWLDRYPRARQRTYPMQQGPIETAVAIIGGGLTGCATACAFALAGVPVVLIEADRIAHGCSSAQSGLVRHEPAALFGALRERHGQPAAITIWNTWRRSGLDFSATIRRLKLRCESAADGSLRLATESDLAEALTAEVQLRRAAGLDTRWITPGRLRQETGLASLGAIRSPGDGYVDPYRVAVGLLDAAVARDALVFEQTAVRRVQRRVSGLELVTTGGVVRAQRVVVATSDLPPSYRALRRYVTSREATCFVTGQLPSFVRREFGRSRATVLVDGSPAMALRRTVDGRLLVCGADHARGSERSERAGLARRTTQLQYEASRLYPALTGVRPEYAWRVPVTETSDGLPVVGPHRMFPGHLFAFGLGYGGVGAAWMVARTLVRLHLGTATPVDNWLGFARLR